MDKVELTPELLRELQLKQLDMLVYFRDFCEKNNLTFWLIGGGLIGALREGGFVPWDDDVDVMLPREDYEKLPALWREQGMDGRFRLLKTDDEVFTGNIFITITQLVWTMLYSLFLAQVVPENHGGILGFGSRVLLGIFRGRKLRNKIWRACEKHMKKYRLSENKCVTELCSGPYWMRFEYPKEIYEGIDYVTFEGLKMPSSPRHRLP